MDYRDLSDEELAERWAAGRSPRVRDEICERFAPLARAHAIAACRKLHHRAAPCTGICDGAFAAGYHEILRRIEGSPARGGSESWLVKWATRRRHSGQTFGAYLRVVVREDDILRAWNRDRGLPQRGDRLPSGMRDRLLPIYRALWDHRPELRRVEALAPAPRLIDRWVAGLWRDAVQTGDGDLLDRTRLTRWVLQTSNPLDAEISAVGQVSEILDDAIAVHWPVWYDAYLDRARQQTNPSPSLDDPRRLELRRFGQAVGL